MTTAKPDLVAVLAQLAELLTNQQPPAPEPVRLLPQRVLLTVEEAGQQLGIGKTKAYELVRTGALESVQIGRLRRIHTDAITAYARHLVNAQQTRLSAA